LLHEADGTFRYKVVGVSDSKGYLHSESGLDVPRLFEMIGDDKTVANKFYLQAYSDDAVTPLGNVSFSTRRDDLIRDNADVLIPAAPVANYIGLDKTTDPSMTLHQIGHWHLIVEGANTYSAIAERKSERRSIERVLYRERGTFIGTDFLVNSGGVIYAAHELLVPTPDDLRLPEEMRGDADACEKWFARHADSFAALAEERAAIARDWRDRVIRENMTQLVERLVKDRNRLPCDVAEDIARTRIEKARTVDGLMTDAFVRVHPSDDLHAVASKMKDVPSEVALVEREDGTLLGILTDWDIVEAVAECVEDNCCAEDIMTGKVFTLSPSDSIAEVRAVARKHGYSAMPVVDDDEHVLGIVQLPDLIET
jgi:glutamate dehydrogenase (NAD(P)+)